MKKSLFFFLLVGFFSFVGAQNERVALYSDGDGSYSAFRIPALLKTSNGNLLAFAEGRWNGLDDAFDIDLVVRRSTDNGKTWGPIEIVWDDADNTCGNPTPVQDPSTGRIFLFMNWNLGPDEQNLIESSASIDTRRIYLTYSDDEGQTWSDPVDMTATLKDTLNGTWHGMGPCHGIVKTRAPHRGRLILPAYYKDKNGKGYAYIIYSDDHGRTWHRGTNCVSGDVPQGASECAVAECSDGSLYLSMRTIGPRDGLRHYALSIDGGYSWTSHYVATSLFDPRCQGAVVNGSVKKANNTLLYLHPQNTQKRADLVLSVSRNDGRSWNNRKFIYPIAAYSDLFVIAKNKVALLYEADNYTHIYYQVVDF